MVAVRYLSSVTVALGLVLGGCGGGDEDAGSAPAAEEPPEAERLAPDREPPRIEPVRCPPSASNCASAAGTIVYVERVDPDGDGDAHFVLLSRQSVTGLGISVIDVARDLRPHPLPGIGDLLAAAGPVFTGSYGQRQIQATEVRVARSSRARRSE